MKKINYSQGSSEWLNWRKNMITATDAAVIMGISPYCTAYKLWQRKLGLIPEQSVNKAMIRGTEQEPIARDIFNKSHQYDMQPAIIESEKYKFLGASLDGLSACGKYILEIKSQPPVKGIPDFHYAQIQHQMLCSDHQVIGCYYVTIWEGKIDVKFYEADLDWMNNYISHAKKFWENILFNEPPDLTQKDYKDMSFNKEWNENSKEYVEISYKIKLLEEEKDKIRKKLIDSCENQNCVGAGVRVLCKINKGRVDYEAIPELKNMNLDKYRKKSTISWTILVDKN